MLRWDFLHRRRSESPDAALAEWHPPDRFRHVLLRERLLADRFGGRILTVSLLVPEGRRPGRRAREAALCFKKRLRFSDEIGWMDEACTQVGVAMHRTPAAEACKLADEICRDFCDADPCTSLATSITILRFAGEIGGGGDEAEARGEGRRNVLAMEPLFVLPLPAWKRGIDIIGAVAGVDPSRPADAGNRGGGQADFAAAPCFITRNAPGWAAGLSTCTSSAP